MIDTLKKQMLTAAKNLEYTRAEQFKKRVEELTADMDNIPHKHVDDIRINQ
jgi:excinuclease UvrABC helicase subunit UvrB